MFIAVMEKRKLIHLHPVPVLSLALAGTLMLMCNHVVVQRQAPHLIVYVFMAVSGCTKPLLGNIPRLLLTVWISPQIPLSQRVGVRVRGASASYWLGLNVALRTHCLSLVGLNAVVQQRSRSVFRLPTWWTRPLATFVQVGSGSAQLRLKPSPEVANFNRGAQKVPFQESSRNWNIFQRTASTTVRHSQTGSYNVSCHVIQILSLQRALVARIAIPFLPSFKPFGRPLHRCRSSFAAA